jgi:hypothetical protein
MFTDKTAIIIAGSSPSWHMNNVREIVNSGSRVHRTGKTSVSCGTCGLFDEWEWLGVAVTAVANKFTSTAQSIFEAYNPFEEGVSHSLGVWAPRITDNLRHNSFICRNGFQEGRGIILD